MRSTWAGRDRIESLLRSLKKRCASLLHRCYFDSNRKGLLRNFEPFTPSRHGKSTALAIPIRTPRGHIDGSHARMQRKRWLIEWNVLCSIVMPSASVSLPGPEHSALYVMSAVHCW